MGHLRTTALMNLQFLRRASDCLPQYARTSEISRCLKQSTNHIASLAVRQELEGTCAIKGSAKFILISRRQGKVFPKSYPNFTVGKRYLESSNDCRNPAVMTGHDASGSYYAMVGQTAVIRVDLVFYPGVGPHTGEKCPGTLGCILLVIRNIHPVLLLDARSGDRAASCR
jgi:hypothetical protein